MLQHFVATQKKEVVKARHFRQSAHVRYQHEWSADENTLDEFLFQKTQNMT